MQQRKMGLNLSFWRLCYTLARTYFIFSRRWALLHNVRRQSFPECRGVFVAEALVRFLFEFRRLRLGAATGVFGLSVS